MIACPVCLTDPDRYVSEHRSWIYCSCSRLMHPVSGEYWIFTRDLGQDDYIEIERGGSLVHYSEDGMRSAVPEGERAAFVRRYVESTLVQDVIDS